MIPLREGDTPAEYATRVRDRYVAVTSEEYFDRIIEPWLTSHLAGSRSVPEVDRRWWFTPQDQDRTDS